MQCLNYLLNNITILKKRHIISSITIAAWNDSLD